MKHFFKAVLSLSLLSLGLGGGSVVFAQSGKTAEIKLSPAAMEILCKRFPLNSRCTGGTPAGTAAPAMTPSSAPVAPAATMQTIPQVAAANGFKTLTAALKAADLVTVLEGTGPFTVFAPTDAAFAALPAGTVEMLLKPENKAKLTKVLTYHVLPTQAVSSGLTSMSATTVEGSPINITVGSGVKVNEATVTKADVMAKNGVIHVIDKVLLPPDL